MDEFVLVSIFLFLIFLYFLPTIIAVISRKKQVVAIALINLLLGWSLIGWIVALIMSVWNDK